MLSWSKHHSEIKDWHKYFVPSEKVYGIRAGDVQVYGRTYRAFLYYDSKRTEEERETIHMKLRYAEGAGLEARKKHTAK